MAQRTVEIIGVPMDLGQSLRGVDVGPSAIRYTGLAERLRRLCYEVVDHGNLEVPVRDTLFATGGMDLAHPIRLVCENLYREVASVVARGSLPVVLGGDHSIAIGSVGGATTRDSVGVLWVDAHADYNTPELSPSGNIHGMPLAILTGRGPQELIDVGRPGAKVAPENVVLIALRDLDAGERRKLRDSHMHIYTMRSVDERGIGSVVREALKQIGHLERIHVSLDLDSVDPDFAPGVGTPVTGGLNTREAQLLMELLAEDGRVGSVDVVEINPILDVRNRTAALAADLLASLLGKTIL